MKDINLKVIKSFFKKFWYIFVTELVVLGVAVLLFLHFDQKTTYVYKTEIYLNTNASNSSANYIYRNSTDLILTDEFKKDLAKFISDEKSDYDLSKQTFSLEKEEISSFMFVASTSSDPQLSEYASTKCTEFFVFLSSKEGMEKYKYASYFKVGTLEVVGGKASSFKKYTTLSYLGGAALAFGMTLITMTVCVFVNGKAISSKEDN